MRTRKEILEDIVSMNGNLCCLENEISSFPWDSEEELIEINSSHLSSVIKGYLEDKVELETLVKWANMIECRDDIGFGNEYHQEVIFELANPEINGETTKDSLKETLAKLENQASV